MLARLGNRNDGRMICWCESCPRSSNQSDCQNYLVPSFDFLAKTILVQHDVEGSAPPAFLCDDAPARRLVDQFLVAFRVLLDHGFGDVVQTHPVRNAALNGN